VARVRLANAENLFEVRAVLEKALAENVRPTLVIARTHIGYGAPNKQDTAKAHGEPLGTAETLQAKQKLGWPTEPAFHVPPAVLRNKTAVIERGAAAEAAWNDLLARYRVAHPDLAAQWDALTKNGPLPADWEKSLPAFGPNDAMATRQASGKTLNALAKALPFLLGGSADLGPSNNSRIEAERSFSAQTPEGRNLHFGIREHAMGAILNGMALSGRVIPYGATFLTFADYMRPAIRLAALMKLGVVYIFTHDSIGVGEDGPTHQPVEHLASLRAIPGLGRSCGPPTPTKPPRPGASRLKVGTGPPPWCSRGKNCRWSPPEKPRPSAAPTACSAATPRSCCWPPDRKWRWP
jgi:transketolase